ncbi:MAG: twin-arginine translocase subunit TatB [Alphaproteobacteria bacterium]|nr:twin-arginine translocase subunit TatB [Alphaproteobacteria bacterium]MCB9698176.1 twin-arginine translocase subunit TatB [Alphaproteobacteria bacterium]
MFGLGTGELLVVAAIALLVIGPERLPRVMRTLGQYYGQLRRTADDLRRAFVMEADRQDAEERYRQLRERRQKEIDARKQREAEQAPAAEPEAAAAEAPDEEATVLAQDAIVPNDIPPDAPHPSLGGDR